MALAVLAIASACALPAHPPQQQAGGGATPPDSDAAALAAAAPAIDATAAALAGARTYSGVLSCAGCADLRLTLTIFADGTFRMLKSEAAGDAIRERRDMGRWAASPGAADTLALRGSMEGEWLFRRVLPDGLAVVDNEGREIRGLDNAVLARAPAVDALAGPLRLAGHYRVDGGQPVFVECLTGRRLPVMAAPPASGSPQAARRLAAARSALDAAHQAVSAAPDQPVLAIVQGYFVPRVPQPGSPEKEALVVAAFERAMRDARCEDVTGRRP